MGPFEGSLKGPHMRDMGGYASMGLKPCRVQVSKYVSGVFFVKYYTQWPLGPFSILLGCLNPLRSGL